MNILLIDNYDSFTYNVVALLKQLSIPFSVKKNDEMHLEEVDEFSHIIISPGPSLPRDSGIVPELIKQYYRTHKILGICLGHQAIAEALGAKLEQLHHPRHGMQCDVHRCYDSRLFHSLPPHFKAGLYHSWQVSKEFFPEELLITSQSTQADILSIEHKQFPVFGIQFHPESYMSEYGLDIMINFTNIV